MSAMIDVPGSSTMPIAHIRRHRECERPQCSSLRLTAFPTHVLSTLPDKVAVLDPFVGSGITLDIARVRSLEFTGVDINPLAVLISAVKSGPLRPAEFAWRARTVGLAARADSRLGA